MAATPRCRKPVSASVSASDQSRDLPGFADDTSGELRDRRAHAFPFPVAVLAETETAGTRGHDVSEYRTCSSARSAVVSDELKRPGVHGGTPLVPYDWRHARARS